MSNTWIELNLDVLSRNIESVRKALAPPTQLIFVVKSNAYGHGLLPVACRAWDTGVRWFAVSRMDEALAVRGALAEAQVLVLGVIGPADAAEAARRNLIPVIVSERQAFSLAAALGREGLRLRCHVKIDTGMGRLGLPWQEAAATWARIARLPEVDVAGVCSHFAAAQGEHAASADCQFERFEAVIRQACAQGVSVGFRHTSNSGALLRRAAWDLDGVRPGILLYGYAPGPDTRCLAASAGARASARAPVETRPFLHWKTRVLQVKTVPAGYPVSYDGTFVTPRQTCIATIDVGYADGYSRLHSNNGFVLAGGRRVPIAGRVTMNFTCVDLGPETTVIEGDEVVLLGEQGGASIWADEMGQWRGTIPYEVLTGIRTDIIRIRS